MYEEYRMRKRASCDIIYRHFFSNSKTAATYKQELVISKVEIVLIYGTVLQNNRCFRFGAIVTMSTRKRRNTNVDFKNKTPNIKHPNTRHPYNIRSRIKKKTPNIRLQNG